VPETVTHAQLVVALHGEIDMVSAGDIHTAAVAAVESGYATLVLDLSGVTFLDSSGLKALVTAHKTMTTACGQLVLRRPAEPVSTVLAVANLDVFFRIDG
jgi:anti-sigma B factor antagonist